MRVYPVRPDEMIRQHTLDCAGVLDTSRHEGMDILTRRAADEFKVPMVAVSLVDEHRQWFMSRVGLDVAETPRDVSFCTHTITRGDVMVVADASRDDLFRTSPLVTDAPHIRFYAGASIYLDGLPIGSFCVIDNISRHSFTDSDRLRLRAFAQLAAREVEMARARQGMVMSLDQRLTAAERALTRESAAAHRLYQQIATDMERPARSLSGYLNCLRTILKAEGASDEALESLETAEQYAGALLAGVDRLLPMEPDRNEAA